MEEGRNERPGSAATGVGYDVEELGRESVLVLVVGCASIISKSRSSGKGKSKFSYSYSSSSSTSSTGGMNFSFPFFVD